MGFELHRFDDDVDGELICGICHGVLENPLQTPSCEHAFCEKCIHEWLSHQPVCPQCRQHIQPSQLKQVPRILRNLLSRLQLHCEYQSFGCPEIVKLEVLSNHLNECLYNPKRPVSCESGCGMIIPKDSIPQHNCISAMRDLIEEQQAQVAELRAEQVELRLQVVDQRREIAMLKECLRTFGSTMHSVIAVPPSNQGDNSTAENMVTSDVVEWISSLRPGRITRWGGMISTPDAVLQAVIKRALLESGCPAHIVNELMENAHERRWPHGLATLETRQANRLQYESFVAKRIPGKQAVVMLQCENRHMPADHTTDPGIVMIFAHGVE